MNFGEVKAATKPRVVILISGSGSNMSAIVDALKAEKVEVEIAAVISNKEEVAGLQKAHDRNLHTAVLSHKNFDSREPYSMAFIPLINSFQADLILLAGLMGVRWPVFDQSFSYLFLYVSHSFLP